MTIETYLDDLGSYIQTEGIGTKAVDIFFYGLDESAPNCVALIPYTSGKLSNSIVSGEINPYEPNISIIVRNTDAYTAHSTSIYIYKLLRCVSNQVIGTTQFKNIQEHGPPGFVANVDGKYIFSINLSLTIQ